MKWYCFEILGFFPLDSVVSVHNLETFAHKFTLHKTKGASVFAVNIKVRFCCNDLVSATELMKVNWLPWQVSKKFLNMWKTLGNSCTYSRPYCCINRAWKGYFEISLSGQKFSVDWIRAFFIFGLKWHLHLSFKQTKLLWLTLK